MAEIELLEKPPVAGPRTIKFIKGWCGHSIGEIWTPEMGDQASLLVINGKAEYVDPVPELKFKESGKRK